jgi:MoaA/NifB/PqqE/SkfB family radical SAM enzyme
MRPMLPGPWRVTFVTNPDDCNLRCPMCATHGRGASPARPPRRLPYEIAERVALEAGPGLREVVPSTRGEPLLWSGLPALAALLGRHGLRLNLTTNGTFPGRGPEGWADLLCPVASDVKVSWNGASPGVDGAIMGGRDFAEAEASLVAFAAARDAIADRTGHRCQLSLQVTAQEANVAELPGIVELAARAGVDRVKVNQLQAHPPSRTGGALRASAGGARRWNAAVSACRAAAAEAPRRHGGRVSLQNLVEWPEDGSPLPAGDCPFAGREAWVEVDGRFLPCPAPAAREGRLGDLGSAFTTTLPEAWAGAAWRAVAAGWRDHPSCRDCPLRRPGGA